MTKLIEIDQLIYDCTGKYFQSDEFQITKCSLMCTRTELGFNMMRVHLILELYITDHLCRIFGDRWIGRGDPIAWLPRSPNLSPLDIYLWGDMKAIVNEAAVDSEMDLVVRITITVCRVRETSDIFENTHQPMQQRCQSCMNTVGRNFDQLLWYL